MKVLLIFPPLNNKIKPIDCTDFTPTMYSSFPPLGLLYIATYVRTQLPKVIVRVMDCIAEKKSYAYIKDEVSSFKPDVVGLTVFTHGLVDARKVAQLVKSINPSIHVCMGGHHLSVYPVQTLSFPEVDSIIIGEGEETFCALLRYLSGENQAMTIKGLYLKRDINAKCFYPSQIDNLDAMPLYDFSFLSRENYFNFSRDYENMVPLLSSRGCPYQCTFCSTAYKTYRERSIPNILQEISIRLKEGFREILFFDDTFNISSERVETISKAIIDNGLVFNWSFRARANAITFQILQLAKQAGCTRIRFGVETGTDEGLRLIKKGMTEVQIRNALRWCRQLGITTTADYIIGFPFEKSTDDVKKSLWRLKAFAPDFVQINILELIPGSEILEDAIKAGIVQKNTWDDFAKSPTSDFIQPYWDQYLNKQELKELKCYGYRVFYFRPGYILRTLFKMRSFREIKIACRAALRMIVGH